MSTKPPDEQGSGNSILAQDFRQEESHTQGGYKTPSGDYSPVSPTEFSRPPSGSYPVIIQQSPQPVPTAQPQAAQPNQLPTWFMQVIQILVIMIAAAVAFGSQQAEISQLKVNVAELKTDRISKEIFNEKIQEQERNNKRIENQMDRIEVLLQGLYDKINRQASSTK